MNNTESKQRLNYGLIVYLLIILYVIRLGYTFAGNSFLFSITTSFVIGIVTIIFCCAIDKEFPYVFFQANLVWLLIYVVIIFLLSLLMGDNYNFKTVTYIKNVITLFSTYGVYLLLYRSQSKIVRKIVLIYFIGIVLSAAYTLFVSITGPEHIIRMTAEGVYYYNLFPLKYGGYDFIYALVFVYVGLICFYGENKERLAIWKKVIIVSALVLFAITVISANFTTAFVLLLIFTGLNISKNKRTRILFFAILTVLLFIAPQLLAKLVDSLPLIQQLTADRLKEIIYSFNGMGVVSDYRVDGDRLSRILASLKVIGEHPFIGGYVKGSAVSLGGHTEWIDTMARYGVPAFAFFVAFWTGTKKRMMRKQNCQYGTDNIIKIAFFLLLVLGLVDPLSMEITVAPIFIFYPFMSELFGVYGATSKDDGRY